MQERERAILWIIRCITALLSMRKHLKNHLEKLQKLILKSYCHRWMKKDTKHLLMKNIEKS